MKYISQKNKDLPLTCYISTDLEVPSKAASPLSQARLSASQVTHSLTYLFPEDVYPV